MFARALDVVLRPRRGAFSLCWIKLRAHERSTADSLPARTSERAGCRCYGDDCASPVSQCEPIAVCRRARGLVFAG